MKICKVCGTICDENATYCIICGAKLSFQNDLNDEIKSHINDVSDASSFKMSLQLCKLNTSENSMIAPLLRRIELEDRDFQSADNYCERILDIDPENGAAYIGKLFAKNGCNTPKELISLFSNITSNISNEPNYSKAYRFGSADIKDFLNSISISISSAKESLRSNREMEVNKQVISDVLPTLEADSDGTDEEYIDMLCPYCNDKLSFLKWQYNEGNIICPFCDKRIK